MTLDSVPELARRVLHLEMELKRNKPSHGTDNAALLKRISALESSVAMISKATPAKPQVYTPKPAVTVPKPTDKSLATKMATLEREVERLKVKERPGAWKGWTPTLTSGTGTFTSATATGKYMRIGKTVYFKAIVIITTNGTAAIYAKITLPFQAEMHLRESPSGEAVVNTTGGLVCGLQCSIFPATHLQIYKYDGTYPGADGRALIVSGFYEAA